MSGVHRGGPAARDATGTRPTARAARAIRLLEAVVMLVGFGGIVSAGSAEAGSARTAGGRTWGAAPSPNQDQHATAIDLLSAVSCASSRACTAVGSWEDSVSSPSFGLAETWNGARWRIRSTVLPRGAVGGELRAVSCTSATSCVAVGYAFEKAHRSVNVAEAWDGARWRLLAIPDPKGSVDASPLALSCSAPDACTAVGFSSRRAGQDAMAERWNGATWRIEALPEAAATELYGVSCPAARACVAVGDDRRTGSPLAEAWNGKTWHVEASSIPHGSSGGILSAVSCTSPRACTATGGAFGTSRPMLAERWNGSRWTVQPAPGPADASTSPQQPELDGVACRSATVCAATGEYAPGGHSAYFLEEWSGGRWHLVGAPHPAGFTSGALNGVSCVPARCTAVGAWSGGPISIATLALAD